MNVHGIRSRIMCGLYAFLAIGSSSASGQTDGERVYKQVAPSVVTITAGDSTGTGFLVRDRRTFITAAHVVSNGEIPVVKFGKGSFLTVRAMTVSKSLDLAVLEVEDEVSAKPLLLGDRDEISPGIQVFAIGNALGALSHTLTDGLLSSKRQLSATELIQVTSPFSAGMSGGPVLSKDSRVLGVISFTFTEGQNLNIAVAAKHVRSLLAEPLRPTLIVTEDLKRSAKPVEIAIKPTESATPKPPEVQTDNTADKAQALSDLLSEVNWLVNSATNDLYRIYYDSTSMEDWRLVHNIIERVCDNLPLLTTDGKANEVYISDRIDRLCKAKEFDSLAKNLLSISNALLDCKREFGTAIIDLQNLAKTKEQREASFERASSARNRVLSMLIDFDKDVLAMGGKLAVKSRLGPKYYGMYSMLIGVHYDSDRPEVAAVRWRHPAWRTDFNVGDVITGLRLPTESDFKSISNWQDVHRFLPKATENQEVVVRLRSGRVFIVSLKR